MNAPATLGAGKAQQCRCHKHHRADIGEIMWPLAEDVLVLERARTLRAVRTDMLDEKERHENTCVGRLLQREGTAARPILAAERFVIERPSSLDSRRYDLSCP